MQQSVNKGVLVDRKATVLVNQLGYGSRTVRSVLVAVSDPGLDVELWLDQDGRSSRQLDLTAPQATPSWKVGWHRRAQLPMDLPAGNHVLRLIESGLQTAVVVGIADDCWQLAVVSDVSAYFRSVRSFGEIDRKDRRAGFYDDPDRPPVDARGGWLDASGDFSKFLSHLTYTDTMSPQQIPLCAWAFAVAGDDLAREHPRIAETQRPRLRDEALHGADFLVRFQDPAGYFYTGIFDALTKDLDERVITAPLQDSVRTQRWQAAFRHGGGLAVAALARAAGLDADGEFSRDDYYRAAVVGHRHLVQHSTEYLFSGVETVLDDYCAALAAAELLARADQRGDAAVAAEAYEQVRLRTDGLLGRLRRDQVGLSYLAAAPDGRPFHHAAESGLPMIALLRVAEVTRAAAPDLARRARAAAVQLVRGVVGRAQSVPNPFGYPRHPVGVEDDGRVLAQFFFPHQNETGYWWQGENANVASLSYAASMAAPFSTPAEAEGFRNWAEDLIGWVVGLNPFGACMLQGRGTGAADYSEAFPNLPGGILNGITGGFEDESDIDYAPHGPMAGGDGWRWAEQWIPHSAWFLLAVAAAR